MDNKDKEKVDYSGSMSEIKENGISLIVDARKAHICIIFISVIYLPSFK